MSMILCARSKFGIAIVADKRNHIISNGIRSYQDTIVKFVKQYKRIIYNHGYNQIGGVYWTQQEKSISPDNAALYSQISQEMMGKSDDKSGYVFVTKSQTAEVVITTGVTSTTIINHGRFIRSGSGTKHLMLGSGLNDDNFWRNLVPGAMLKQLKQIFEAAYHRQIQVGDQDFSKAYDAEMVVF